MASPATEGLPDTFWSKGRDPCRLTVPGPLEIYAGFLQSVAAERTLPQHHLQGESTIPFLATISTFGQVATCAWRRLMTCTAYWMAAGTVCCRIPLMSGAQLSPPRARSGRARACAPSSAAGCSAGRRSEGSPGSALPAAAGGRAAPAIDVLRTSVVRVMCGSAGRVQAGNAPMQCTGAHHTAARPFLNHLGFHNSQLQSCCTQ